MLVSSYRTMNPGLRVGVGVGSSRNPKGDAGVLVAVGTGVFVGVGVLVADGTGVLVGSGLRLGRSISGGSTSEGHSTAKFCVSQTSEAGLSSYRTSRS
jgi:hypothetical protein